MIKYPLLIVFILLIIMLLNNDNNNERNKLNDSVDKIRILNNLNIKIINPTFLGNEQRNYYGENCPDKLNILWKVKLGCGKTNKNKESVVWCGAGWTGQPLTVLEHDTLFIYQGAYDHRLRKIRASDGKIIWEYKFDDVIKGTGSIYLNTKSEFKENQLILLQGSRYGYLFNRLKDSIFSYRAISCINGKELWRMHSELTDCYSRDVDASALIINDTAYICFENGLFYLVNPAPEKSKTFKEYKIPEIISEFKLYEQKDLIAHDSNVVIEASPSRLGDKIFIASGSGKIFTYSVDEKSIEIILNTGSDIDGTPVVTNDSCILVSIEKQYIKGNGGLIKVNPKFRGDSAIVWFFPTQNNNIGEWKGGIIGSPAVNDFYNHDKKRKDLCATIGIDGYLYLISHTELEMNVNVTGFDGITKKQMPKLLDKRYIGPGISTPLIIDSTIIAANYSGIFLFRITKEYKLKFIDKYLAPFEATPFVYDKKIYVASRDGYLYCFGN